MKLKESDSEQFLQQLLINFVLFSPELIVCTLYGNETNHIVENLATSGCILWTHDLTCLTAISQELRALPYFHAAVLLLLLAPTRKKMQS